MQSKNSFLPEKGTVGTVGTGIGSKVNSTRPSYIVNLHFYMYRIYSHVTFILEWNYTASEICRAVDVQRVWSVVLEPFFSDA